MGRWMRMCIRLGVCLMAGIWFPLAPTIASEVHPPVLSAAETDYGRNPRKGILDRRVHFLQKPFSLQEISPAVRRALDG